MKVELFVIPIAAIGEKLCVLIKPDTRVPEKYTFPNISLEHNIPIRNGVHRILENILSAVEPEQLDTWFNSPRCKDRIVNVFDKDLFYENTEGTVVVKTIAIPEEFSSQACGRWADAKNLLSANSELIEESKHFLKECAAQIPLLARNTSFPFELLSRVFSIQDLRLLVALISSREVDPGHFHRRLKGLDILRPFSTEQPRVHRWEFAWDRSDILARDGLTP